MTPKSKRFTVLDFIVSLRECLPPDHLARFVVDVIAQL